VIVDVLFPVKCAGCGVAAGPLCAACERGIRRALPCAPPAGVDSWLAPFAYEGVARELIARAKYRNARSAVPWLVAAMVEEVRGAGVRVDVVTWAPTTPARRRSRGFDPAEVLARAVARRLRSRARRLLVRAPGPPQTGQPAAIRRIGPRFRARGAVASHVLLVDDVATTGATLAAAAAALRQGGAREVVAVTAARTPPPGDDRRRAAYTRIDGSCQPRPASRSMSRRM
jgi:predicted amidophosphoribosyltransferase